MWSFSTDLSLFIWHPHPHPVLVELLLCNIHVHREISSPQVSGSQEDGRPSGAQLQELCLEHVEICRRWGRWRSWWWWGCSVQLLQQDDSIGFCQSTHWWQIITDKALYSLGLTYMWQRRSFINYWGSVYAGVWDWTNNRRFTEPQPAQQYSEVL